MYSRRFPICKNRKKDIEFLTSSFYGYVFFRHSKEITILQQHFQQELKAAFSGDTGGIDMLNRVQELEIEIENTRKECEMQLKEMQEVHENEKQQMKDDMATVLQVFNKCMNFCDRNNRKEFFWKATVVRMQICYLRNKRN